MTSRSGWALVGAAWGVLVLVAAVWLALDRRPPEWDYANHLERVVACAQDLRAGDVRAILSRSSFYPPLVPCAAALAYRLAPSDAAAAQSVILLFLGLGMAAAFALGRRLDGPATGVVAAIVFGTGPFVVYSALRFQLDLPLAAVVALALVVLLRTDGFERRGWSLLAGLVLGLGMLTKPPFAAYLLVPALWLLVRHRGRRTLINAALATAVGVAVSLPWYGPRLFGLPVQISHRSFKNAVLEGKPDVLSAAGLGFYPRVLVTQLGVVAVVLLLVGLAVALFRRHGFALVSLLGPFVLFTFVQNKDPRYTLPLLPLAAALAGLAATAMRGRLRLAVTALVGVAAAAQVSATAFGVPPNTVLPGVDVAWVPATPPVRDDWHQRDLLAAIDRDRGGRPARVSVVPNAMFFSVSNFRYYAVRDGRALAFTRAWDEEPVGVDYMVLKTGDVGPPWTEAKPRRIAERLATDRALAAVYPVIAEQQLPDGSTATVRARRPPAVTTAPAALARTLEAAFRARLAEVARDVDGLDVRLTYDDALRSGRVARVELGARAATLAEFRRRDAARLRVHDLRLVLDDVLVNPVALGDGERLAPLDVGRVRIDRATIEVPDLESFLAGLKEFRDARVRADGDAVDIALPRPRPGVRARVRLVPAADRPFAVLADRVRVGPLPVPGPLVSWVIRHYDPSAAIASRVPFPVEIGSVVVADGAVRIVPRR